jgi:hypothetical protein
MMEESGDSAPLPREWLPEAVAPEDAAEWQVRLERIVAAAEPTLRGFGPPTSVTEMPWSTALGGWWKPAAALAGAAAALLFMLDMPESHGRGSQNTLPLSVAAAEGEPFALWDGFGIDADPALALIALQEQAP